MCIQCSMIVLSAQRNAYLNFQYTPKFKRKFVYVHSFTRHQVIEHWFPKIATVFRGIKQIWVLFSSNSHNDSKLLFSKGFCAFRKRHANDFQSGKAFCRTDNLKVGLIQWNSFHCEQYSFRVVYGCICAYIKNLQKFYTLQYFISAELHYVLEIQCSGD